MTSPRRQQPISYSTIANGTLPSMQSPKNSLMILHPMPTQTAAPAIAQSTSYPDLTVQLMQHYLKTGPTRSEPHWKMILWKAALAPPCSRQLPYDPPLAYLIRLLPPPQPSSGTQHYPSTVLTPSALHQKPNPTPPPYHLQPPYPPQHPLSPLPLTGPHPHPPPQTQSPSPSLHPRMAHLQPNLPVATSATAPCPSCGPAPRHRSRG